MPARTRRTASPRGARVGRGLPPVRLWCERLEERRLLSVFLVNSNGDSPDPDLTDGICGTATPGEVTLRAAIQNANRAIDLDEIHFAIPGNAEPSIAVTGTSGQFMAITAPVQIDGSTQFAGHVEINGAGVTGDGTGLVLTPSASGSVIRSLVLNRFSGVALLIMADNVSVVGNYIGLDPTGSTCDPDGTPNSGDELGNRAGIKLVADEFGNGGRNNVVGGSNAADRNIISGNGVGIFVSVYAGHNRIIGNYIGTDVSGAHALAPGAVGIFLRGNSYESQIGTYVGGSGDGEGNLISGNGAGILINDTWNRINGNLIGTSADGTNAVGNYVGVKVFSAPAVFDGIPNLPSELRFLGNEFGAQNYIGSERRNIISGNRSDGIVIDGWVRSTSANVISRNWIGLSANGLDPLPNLGNGIFTTGIVSNSMIGGFAEGEGNVIAANGANGILLNEENSITWGKLIVSNYIGLGADGLTPRGNAGSGVSILDTSHCIFEGRNVIAANGAHGIAIAGHLTSDISISGAVIGLDKNEHAGAGLGNGGSGIDVQDSSENLIGNPLENAVNVIANNVRDGITVSGDASQSNKIRSNIIGTNRRWEAGLGNGGNGITIDHASQTQIGQNFGEQFIAGNVGHGVFLRNSQHTVLEQNAIGFVPRYATAALNLQVALPNQLDGVHVELSSDTSVNLNVIAGNGGDGVEVGSASDRTTLTGNAIGIIDDGLRVRIGNGGSGVRMVSAQSTRIERTANDIPNSIQANALDGVTVIGGGRHVIRGNQIRDNDQLGIDLGDDGPDTAAVLANDYSNGRSLPEITSAAWTPHAITIAGTLAGLANTSYELDFYASAAPDASGRGEGAALIPVAAGAARFVTTGVGGTASFQLALTPPASLGELRWLAATATEMGDTPATSEFSPAVEFHPQTDVRLLQFTTANGSLARLMIQYEVLYLDAAPFDFTVLASGDEQADGADLVQGSPVAIGTAELLSVGTHVVYIDDPSAYLSKVTDPATPCLLVVADRQAALVETDLGNNSATFVGPPFHNLNRPWDVDRDLAVGPVDWQQIVDYLNAAGIGAIDARLAGNHLIDVTGDSLGTPRDALVLVNYLNAAAPVPLAKRGAAPAPNGNSAAGAQGAEPISPAPIAVPEDLWRRPARRKQVATAETVGTDGQDRDGRTRRLPDFGIAAFALELESALDTIVPAICTRRTRGG